MTSTHSSLIGQVCSAGSKLLVQSTVFDKFIGKLKTRLGHFRIGHSLDKTIDMAAIVDESQRRSVAEFVEEAVIAPLVLLCGDLAGDAELSRDDLTDLFDNQLIEEDVLPLMQMAM